jgi:hypothetical protein
VGEEGQIGRVEAHTPEGTGYEEPRQTTTNSDDSRCAMSGTDHRNPDLTDGRTRRADEEEARSPHEADRPPTEAEEARAEEAAEDVPDEAGERYREIAERGANVEGEGRIG